MQPARSADVTLRVLCIVADADRPTMETFVALHRSGVAITVSCLADTPHLGLLGNAGVPTVDLPLRRNVDPAGIRRLRALFDRERFHIVHVYSNRALSNVLLAARGRDIRIVAYRGIVGAVSFLDPMSWLRYLNPRIDRIVCVCEAVRQYFLTMRPAFLRMPADRPVTIYKGHRLEWYDQKPANLASLGIPAGAFVIACVANYRPRKGVRVLIEAMRHLPGDLPAHLLLVGNMSGPVLDRLIAASPARDRIHRPGFRSDAQRLTAASDVFCLASTKREGLPRSVIEAMAYRVPAIVTDSGGSPELVVDGESGLVVPLRDPLALADAIETLYRDPQRRARMGQAARDRIGNDFRHDETVRGTLALYRELAPDT